MFSVEKKEKCRTMCRKESLDLEKRIHLVKIYYETKNSRETTTRSKLLFFRIDRIVTKFIWQKSKAVEELRECIEKAFAFFDAELCTRICSFLC